MLQKIKESAEFLQKKTNSQPKVGVILGTGLGGLVNEIDIKHSIAYEEIPNFPISTVEGHSGKLIFGLLGNKEIIVMQGRFHYYEGYDINIDFIKDKVLEIENISSKIINYYSKAIIISIGGSMSASKAFTACKNYQSKNFKLIYSNSLSIEKQEEIFTLDNSLASKIDRTEIERINR